MFWKNKKVLVTGGAGFLGSHVVEELARRQALVTIADNLSNGQWDNISGCDLSDCIEGDLRDLSVCEQSCNGQEMVLNLAATVGGVGYNMTHQAKMFSDNMLINLNMLNAANKSGVERFLVVSSACVYERNSPIPHSEANGFRGEPEETNYGYGWAKRMAEVAGKAYADQHGMKIAIVRPYNAYGPKDSFSPDKSHVIASLINKVMSGQNPVSVWGDGKQTRSFLYADDFAKGLLAVAEAYPECDPVNIGTDEEITVRDLAKMILKISGVRATLEFDNDKPSGQPRRKGSTEKARKVAGWSAQTSLEDGLTKTIDWYARTNKALRVPSSILGADLV